MWHNFESFFHTRAQNRVVMAISKSTLESGPQRLKDTPRPEDLEAATSPAARLLAWLRS